MKKLTQSSLCLMFGLLLLSGCVATGNRILENESPESIGDKFHNGQTAKAQVIEILGIPGETTFTAGGLEVMKYEYTRTKPRMQNFIPYNRTSQVTDRKRKELVVLFDRKLLVKKIVMNVIDEQTRFGIIE
ncbi:MAG: outer membrane protein assembly factor BamE (lipoprotein component of BamABCDE complex) [Porticoccaceae bacterium]|jgi:outer membrane protein assembly factor BamE (lipoprotein component of BamABCDE complex)